MDIYLAQPRGFCIGVTRALKLVDETLRQFGPPIYVRHEIVHNKHIIENLKQQGVIFIEELEEVSDSSRPIIFSAHGVPQKVKEQAEQKHLHIVDATCPLVESVHHQIKKIEKEGAEIIVIGKVKHPEIQGTVGQLENPASAHVIATLEEAQKLSLSEETPIGIVTQTTLSASETKEMIQYLQNRFKNIVNNHHYNICMATSLRQKAVQELVKKTKNILIIGSKNSSNSSHLKEIALQSGAGQAWLIDDASEADWKTLDECESLGISAGASAPEHLVTDLLNKLQQRYHNINLHDVIIKENSMRS